jgi:2-polyprenyl-6-methoxyphenol hydroxylase-like FAD-dependent oxidoreductase
MKILIIGGGVGGLALVGCLKKQGINDITLIEHAPEFHHIGYLIGLWGNGRAIMKYLNIDNITEKNGYEVDVEIIKTDIGKHLKTFRVSFGSKLESTVTMSRADLHEGLLSLLSDTRVKFNTTTKEIRQVKDFVEVTFSDDTEEKFDLVVGADGIHSQTREQIFGSGFLKYYGWRAWSYWLPKDFKYPKQPIGLLGEEKSIFILPSHDSSTVTFIAKMDVESIKQNVDHREEIKKNFSEFGDFATEVLKTIPDSSEIWSDNIAHIDMPTWYKGRVVLLGDAQHAVSPIVGMGSSMAMEDAYVLADELGKNKNDTAFALEQYSKRRNTRMKKFLKQVSRMDKWMKARGFLVYLRDWMTPFTPQSYFTGRIRKLMKEKI